MRVEVRNLDAALALLSTGAKKAKAGLRKGSRAAAKVLAAAVKAAVPSVSGQAKANIKVRSLARSRRRVGATVRIWIRTGTSPYYAFRDLGTKKMTGGRYFDKAFKSTHGTAERILVDTVLHELGH